MGIPNRFHFCYGFAAQPQEFLFAHYLAVKSAAVVNEPESIQIHYDIEPVGPWWAEARKIATAVAADAPVAIFERPLKHPAHIVDVFRLATLIEHGGIYMDIDTLCLRPLAPLLSNELVMAEQLGPDGAVRGLGNAVILATAWSPFLCAWFDQYRTFRSEGIDSFWDEHSVQIPYRRLLKDPALRGHATVLEPEAFFHPPFHEAESLFVQSDVSGFEDSYCTHLWEQITHKHMLAVTPESVRDGGDAYSQLARRFL